MDQSVYTSYLCVSPGHLPVSPESSRGYPERSPGDYACSARTKTKSTPQTLDYFPPAGQWQHRSPASLGLDSMALQDAIRFAQELLHGRRISRRTGIDP